MVKVNVREFAHDLAGYLKRAESGEDLVITRHDWPMVNITRHRPDMVPKGWKRPIKRLDLPPTGLSASAILAASREEARY